MLIVYKDFPAPCGSRCVQYGQYRDVFPWELSFRSQQRTLLRPLALNTQPQTGKEQKISSRSLNQEVFKIP